MKDKVYVVEKKKWEYSKIMNLHNVIVVDITWLAALVNGWFDSNVMIALLSFVGGNFLAMLPYTMVAMSDRWLWAKQKESEE